MNNERALNTRREYQNWVKAVSGGSLAVYYPGFVQPMGGIKAALLLSQLLYWDGVQAAAWNTGASNARASQRSGWIYKSVEDLQRETGLSKCEQQTARKTLLALGVIEARLKGIPRIWYYRIDWQRLCALMGDPRAKDPQPGAELVSMQPPLDEQAGQSKGQTDPTLGRSSAQLNNESENTTENTNHLAGEDQNGKCARSDPPRDPRMNHPAVILIKTVTGLCPPQAVMNRVIRALGDAPEAERFANVHETWCARGFRRTNLDGQLDWYRKGIPPLIPPGQWGRGGAQAQRVKRLEEDPRSEAELSALRAKLRATREAAKQKD